MARQEFNQTITDFAEFVGMKDKEIIKLIGAMQSLTTTQKDTIVGAINEMNQRINSLSSSAAGINDSATNETATLSAKKILELLNQAKADVKNELLGGQVDASIDTIKELGDMLKNIQTGEDGLNKLVQKITQTNQSLSLLVGKFTVLDGINLKEAYNRGYNK
nr:MAG TPA: Heat shock factor-binding protein 1 helix, Nucleus, TRANSCRIPTION.8A [Caudoviricetes sp.]